jgi:beta-lactamase class A
MNRGAALLVVLGSSACSLAEPPKELQEGLALFDRPSGSGVQTAAELPDSIAAKHLRHILDVINGSPLGDATKSFTPDFLEYIPADEIASELASVGQSYEGEKVIPVSIDATEARPDTITATVSSRRGRSFLTIFLLVNDETGLVSALRIDPARTPSPSPAPPAPADWGEFAGELDDLPGEVGFGAWALIESAGGTQELLPIAGQNEHKPLAIGSSFKLWVLGALAEDVLLSPQASATARAWTDTFRVQDTLKSLPSGTLQLRPEGELVTLAHAATQMMAISDNTATDHLLHHLSRERVEAFLGQVVATPERNTPLLSTREAFVLKLSDDDAMIERYLASNSDERRAMLQSELATQTPDLAQAGDWDAPRLIEHVEWFASAHDCARTLARLRELEVLAASRDAAASATHSNQSPPAIQSPPAPTHASLAKPLSDALRTNPGLSLNPKVWRSVAFKGGSEPGVLHSCWMLERADGKWFVFSLGWNDSKELIDQDAFLRLAYQGVDLLSRDGLAPGQSLPEPQPATDRPATDRPELRERVPPKPEENPLGVGKPGVRPT